jgi:hypothetical protein
MIGLIAKDDQVPEVIVTLVPVDVMHHVRLLQREHGLYAPSCDPLPLTILFVARVPDDVRRVAGSAAKMPFHPSILRSSFGDSSSAMVTEGRHPATPNDPGGSEPPVDSGAAYANLGRQFRHPYLVIPILRDAPGTLGLIVFSHLVSLHTGVYKLQVST